MPVSGLPKFNAVALLEVEPLNFMPNQLKLIGKGAFVSTETGHTYGYTSMQTGWSRETLAALEALRGLMERDMAELVFKEVSAVLPTPGKPVVRGAAPTVPTGIGEELHEAEQV